MSESESEVVVSKAARVEIVDPWRAAKHDPTMSEWLRLTPSDSCPEDSTHGWGTINPRGYLAVRRCNVPGCWAKFRPHVDARLVAEVAQALVGTPKRFIMGWVDDQTDRQRARQDIMDVCAALKANEDAMEDVVNFSSGDVDDDLFDRGLDT